MGISKSSNVIFNSNLIERFIEPINFDELINKLSKKLLEKELIDERFSQAVKKREKIFPTGLPTEPIGVAIPHTDSKYVKKNSICIGILSNPIRMTVMGTKNKPVLISLVFLLALSESNKQLNILSHLMKIFQDKELLKNFLTMTNDEITQKINEYVLEELL